MLSKWTLDGFVLFVCEMILKETMVIKINSKWKFYQQKNILQKTPKFKNILKEKKTKKTNYEKLIKKSNEIVLKIKWQNFEKTATKKCLAENQNTVF